METADVSPRLAEFAKRAANSHAPERSNVVQLPTRGLPPGKSAEEALQRAVAYRKLLWTNFAWMFAPEEERIEALIAFCTKLYGGDELAGKLLASAAVYE